jgi:polysaccharide export outer membrane protein
VLVFFLLICPGLLAQETAENTPQPLSADTSYRLGAGDRIKISVFNQEDLTGEYSLDGKARFSMPLIGTVEAGNLTASELESVLVRSFKPDYLVNPRVYVQVLNYRPYYLIGEVNTTGAFPYVAGMTYLKAIAIAGGFSYRAKRGVVYVIRGTDIEQEEVKLDVDEKVRPGDIIRVAERMF